MQSLREVGCDEDTISQICSLYDAGQVQDAVRVMRRHRLGLLEDLHQSQNRVDRFDYLVYKMEKHKL